MTEPRPKLRLRLAIPSPEQPADIAARLTKAIEQKACVRWTYNRLSILAAPQVLYRKNEGIYCDAVVLERDGKMPLETKLASFNLAGLTRVKLTGDPAEPAPDLDLAEARYQGGILARIAR
jgi:hypothetical protein